MELKLENYSGSIFEAVESFRTFIKNTESKNLSVDITNFNLIDGAKLAILCSTYHFAQYPDGKLIWETDCRETEKNILKLQLKNVEVKVRNKKADNVIPLRAAIA